MKPDSRRRLEMFEKIVERSYDAIIIADEQRRISYWSPAAEQTFGFTADEVLDKDMHSLITPARYRERANAAQQTYRRTGRGNVLGKRVEIEALHKDGHEIWVELSINDINMNGERWAFAIVREVTQRKRMESQLERQAMTDPLSGLYNRRAFQIRLEERAGEALLLAFLDADRFKQINDAFGHDAGDEVIRCIAASMASVFPDACCLARMGGDEFAVLLASSDRAGFEQRLQCLVADIAGRVHRTSGLADISLSSGIASLEPGDRDLRSLLINADRALYAAKQGRATATAGPVIGYREKG
ncbi:MAG: diguanylate cyclase [Gammaproteobacteria bacterium]|nr:diguanylate cyclase [Gammaproteobacteria bacterium]